MRALAFLASDFLRWLIDKGSVPRSEDTAMNWLIAAVVISACCTAGAMVFKAISKRMAKNVEEKIWSRGQTLLLMIFGLAPVLVTMAAVWYMTRNFFNIVGVGGLFKGIVLGWLIYLVLMFCAHLVSPWRHELL
jgi:hypothetical protein